MHGLVAAPASDLQHTIYEKLERANPTFNMQPRHIEYSLYQILSRPRLRGNSLPAPLYPTKCCFWLELESSEFRQTVTTSILEGPLAAGPGRLKDNNLVICDLLRATY